MKLVVTGSGGFLGAHVARRALSAGHSVVGVGRSVRPARLDVASSAGFRYLSLDVAAPSALARFCAEERPEAVVHVAAAGVLRKDPSGAAELLRAHACAGVEVGRAAQDLGLPVIWIGSCFEYAPAEGLVSESWPLEPSSLYGKAKLLGWHAFRALVQDRAPHATLRPFHLYGPGDYPARFAAAALLAALGKGPNEFGDPSLVRDFVYVEDAAEAIVRAAEALAAGRLAAGAALNLATGHGTSLGDFVRAAARAAGAHDFRPAFLGPPPTSGYDPKRLVGRPDAARAQLGWSAATDVAEGLRRTAALGPAWNELQ